MREVVAKIMEAEADARRLVETARSEAERVLSDAQAKARGLSDRMQRETQSEVDQILATGVRDAKHAEEASLARTAADLESRFRLDDPRLKQAVTATLRCVCDPAP